MSAPSNPVNIRGRPAISAAANGVSGSYTTPVGTPDLRVLRSHYVGTPPPNIPLRGNAATPVRDETALLPPSGSETPISRNFVGGGISARRAETPANESETPPPIDLDDLPEEEKAKVLRRHLVSKEERQKHVENSELPSRPTSAGGNRIPRFREDTEPFPIPYDAPGADITHDIYKWQSDQRRQAARNRAASFSGAHPAPQNPAFEHIHEPGGFRRNFVLLRADEQGKDEPPRILNNFIDFLFIYGHFAGEDLEDDEIEEQGEDEEAADTSILRPDSTHLPSEISESTPLLHTISSRSRSRSRRRRMSIGPHGDATVTQTVLMLLKSFVGTGVLFLGRAFLNGGILFSAATIVFIALISLYSFLLLVKTKFVVSGSFGGNYLGGTLYGPWMRYAILGSIVLSQLGFVAAYTIFVSENLQAFVMGVTHCTKLIPLQYFITLQMIILLPLALIRDLAKLSTTALVADVFILAGLIYIFGTETSIIAKEGIADIKLFNPKDFPLFIGTAVFSFEGIGLVIPITDSMREPRKFPKVLTGVMLFLTVLFGGAGALSYLTFGSKVQTVVLVNFDSESKFVQAVQFLYAAAILLSVPLQLFPAVRIMENGLFIRSGKADSRVKWLKNIFRFSIVLLCSAISWVGAADLDKFVAFVGSFACVPLCYIYPAMLHYRACARTRTQKLADIAMMVFGSVAAVYTTAQTILLMMSPDNSGSPKFGQCA